MKRVVLIGIAGLIVLASPAQAEPTVAEILKEPRPNFTRVYMSALGNGMSWANVAAKMKNGKPVYCPPGKIAITSEQYVDIFGRYVEGNPHLKSDGVGGPMLFALEEAFPLPIDRCSGLAFGALANGITDYQWPDA